MKKIKQNKNAQIWIETVLYTLIGLALISLILAFVMPRINEAKDKATVEQSIESLNEIHKVINDIYLSPGNQRPISLSIKRGEFFIDSSNDQIGFVISDLNKPYSQVGTPLQYGAITILSAMNQKLSSVSLTLNYSAQVNITFNSQDSPILKKYATASIPYKILVKSEGNINAPNSNLYVIDITD